MWPCSGLFYCTKLWVKLYHKHKRPRRKIKRTNYQTILSNFTQSNIKIAGKVWLQPAALDKQICGLLRFILLYKIVGKLYHKNKRLRRKIKRTNHQTILSNYTQSIIKITGKVWLQPAIVRQTKYVVLLRFILSYKIVGKIIPQKQTSQKKNQTY